MYLLNFKGQISSRYTRLAFAVCGFGHKNERPFETEAPPARRPPALFNNTEHDTSRPKHTANQTPNTMREDCVEVLIANKNFV